MTFEMIDANKQPREAWLNNISEDSRKQMRFWFDSFLKYVGKNAKDLIEIRRKEISTGDLNNFAEQALSQWFEDLTSGKIQTKQGKPYSESSAKAFCAAVKSFFSFYGMPLRKKTFKKGKKAILEAKRRHLFLNSELAQVFQRASIRDKAVMILGTMGLDASTVSERKAEEFKGLKVDEFFAVPYVRRKTGQRGVLVLTTEARGIILDYLKTLERTEGALFLGYKPKGKPDASVRALDSETINDIFVKNCNGIIKVPDDEVVNFHCLRKFFSSKMQGVIPQSLIDLQQGHAQSGNEKAYIEYSYEKIKDIYEKTKAEDYLQIQTSNNNGLRKEVQAQTQIISALSRKVSEQEATIQQLLETFGIKGKLETWKKQMKEKRTK